MQNFEKSSLKSSYAFWFQICQDYLMGKKKRKKMMSSLTVSAAMRSAFGVKFLGAKVSCDEVEAQKASSGALVSKLELIYTTGQLCLSWEMLNRQYSMAIKKHGGTGNQSSPPG